MGKYTYEHMTPREMALSKVFEEYQIELPPRLINAGHATFYNPGRKPTGKDVDSGEQQYRYLFDDIIAAMHQVDDGGEHGR